VQRVPGTEPVGLDDEVAERAAVWALVQLLPPRQRATVVLRYYEDLSEAQTAEVLGCSIGTVKAASSRAVARLRVLHAEEVAP
jgi:RNA polymerase sigma factor (sigma-70 family)